MNEINTQFEILDSEVTEIRKKITNIIKNITNSKNETEKNSVLILNFKY
jgi:hypothetical protein